MTGAATLDLGDWTGGGPITVHIVATRHDCAGGTEHTIRLPAGGLVDVPATWLTTTLEEAA